MTSTTDNLHASVARQREALSEALHDPLRQLAEACARVWPDRTQIERALRAAWETVPTCKFMYALDTNAIQICANVSRQGVVEKELGRDRSQRPYMREAVPIDGFLLSHAYISLRAQRPSVTAIQLVRDAHGKALGFVGVDFDLRDLPLTRELYEEPRYWRQIKGDPSIRGSVFHQTRVESEMDKQLDTVISVLEALMTDHGVYHIMLHFSSSRAVVWVVSDPFRYRLLDIKDLMDPDICLAYPRRPYPEDALVPHTKIRAVLDRFRALRVVDEMLYLRSGTLNIFNGVVGLTFSCDGSHYIPFDEFVTIDNAFWVGSETSTA